MNWLNNLKVRSKLLLVLGVLLVGFTITGLVYYQVDQIDKQATVLEQKTNEFGYLTLKVSELILQGRRAEKDFLLRADLKYVKRHDGTMEQVFTTIDRMDQIAATEEERQILLKVRELSAAYQSTFKQMADTKVVLGLNENAGLQGAFRNQVHDVEDLLKKEKAIELTASMLMMRRHEKDFLLREADKYPTRMAGEQKKFSTLLAKSRVPAATRKIITRAMADYYKGFLALVQGTRDYRSAIAVYREKVHALDPELVTLTEITSKATESNRITVDQQRNTAALVFIATLLVTALTTLSLLLLIIRSVARSLGRLTNTVEEVAQGNYDARVNLDTKDELGDLAKAFDNMLNERLANLAQAEAENNQLNDSIINVLEAVSDLSDRDLTVKVPVAEDVTGPVADAMNMMAGEISRVLIDIRDISDEVEQSANTVNNQGQRVTQMAANERKIVQATMEKLDEASRTMNQIAKLAQSCNEIAAKTSASTSEALNSVSNTAEGMNDIRETISETEKRIKRLGERSQEITGVVEIINNIAERTHVLALNASMQAAAAGDAGRGFAVVADEVQRLAESSRQSTAEIQALVSNIQTETAETMATMNKTITQVVDGTKLAQRSGEQMQATQKTTNDLADAIEKIAQHSLKQAKVSNVLREQAMGIVDSTDETSKELVEQAKHTGNLVAFSKKLQDSVRVFKLSA